MFQPRQTHRPSTEESQAEAFEQCWRKDWQDSESHLLAAKHVSIWIQNNLYLSLADAPFDLEDPPSTPQPELASLAHVAADNYLRPPHSSDILGTRLPILPFVANM
jgi:hypothetical protein